MPDTATDPAALTAQVKRLSGDLDRRFEQFSAQFAQLRERIDQLGGRVDALSVKEKFSLAFKAALDRDWVGGTTSPVVSVPLGGPVFVARGTMAVELPNRSRIQVCSASLHVSDRALTPFPSALNGFKIVPNVALCQLLISLERIARDTNNSEPVVELSRPFLPGLPDPQAVPIPGREFVDHDRFTYVLSAAFTVRNPVGPRIDVPPAMVVLDSFQVDCIGA